MDRAIITGVSSFVGERLATGLLAAGAEVTAIIRPTTDPARLAPLLETGMRTIVHDGTTASLTAHAPGFGGAILYHLAGQYVREHEDGDVDTLIAANVGFGASVLEFARQGGLAGIVNTGSYFQFIDGDGPRALNLYAASKQAFLDLVDYYRDAYGLPALTLVIYDTYGPEDRRRKLMAAIRDAQRDGSALPVPADDPLLDFVYGDDMAEAFMHAGRLLRNDTETVDGGLYAVGSGRKYRLSEIVALFEEVGGKPISTEPGRWQAPTRTITRHWAGPVLPGWSARTPLRDGVARFIQES